MRVRDRTGRVVAHRGTRSARDTVGVVPVIRDTTAFSRMIGIGSRARDRNYCLTIANDSLRPGTRLIVVSPRPPQRIDTESVAARRDRACTELGDEWGSAMIRPASYYNVRAADGVELGDVAIIVTGDRSFAERGEVVEADLDGDGDPERFHECASREQVHYFVLTGRTRRWHASYYVPYRLEPDCDDALF